jgi:5-methyltetrahydropteroyltriglutamate--homocysteine methyltransferase
MTQPTTQAPFRADQVGSLLRPLAVVEARARLQRGEISAAEFREIEDAAIIGLIAKQESIGLKAPTDGECRRRVWSIDFFEPFIGMETFSVERGARFKEAAPSSRNEVRITGRLAFPDNHPMLADFRFHQAHTKGHAKMTIPGPAMLHFTRGEQSVADGIYPDIDAFWVDVIATYRKALKAFYDAGCRYIQLDDVVWALLCSQPQREQARARGDDPDRLPATYARVTNAILADRPADLSVTTHACRGNFRSSWSATGGYEPIAERLLGGVDYNGYFLEYDTDRAGGFEPLRFLPKGKKRVVLGLVTSKFGTLESADDIKRRIEEASRFADIDQLCLSPQCGFASTHEGNLISEEEQWTKLRLVVDIARDVWGA